MEAYKRRTVWEFNCLRCGNAWFPRSSAGADAEIPEGSIPKVCPRCKSPYWNRPRRSAEIAEAEARLREMDPALRLRYTGYPVPDGPWVVETGDGVPLLAWGDTAKDVVAQLSPDESASP